MKTLQIRTYGAAMLEIFLASYHFVGAKFTSLYPITAEGSNTVLEKGFRVDIYLKKHSDDSNAVPRDELYLLTFHADDVNEDKAFDICQSNLKNSGTFDSERNSFAKVLSDFNNGFPIETFSEPSSNFLKQLTQKRNSQHTATLSTQVESTSTDISDNVEVFEQCFWGIPNGNVVAGWVLKKQALKRLFDRNKIRSSSLTLMDLEVYITNNYGIYSFTLEDAPHFYFMSDLAPDVPFIPQDEFSKAEVTMFSTQSMQKVEVRPGNVMTTIPRYVYDQLQSELQKSGFTEKNGRYQRSCSSIKVFRIADCTLHITIQKITLFFRPDQYVTFTEANGERICVLQLLPNEENKWVLGSSFLRAYTIIIRTEKNTKAYKFLPRKSRGIKAFPIHP